MRASWLFYTYFETTMVLWRGGVRFYLVVSCSLLKSRCRCLTGLQCLHNRSVVTALRLSWDYCTHFPVLCDLRATLTIPLVVIMLIVIHRVIVKAAAMVKPWVLRELGKVKLILPQ
jgi:hypothetical protein